MSHLKKQLWIIYTINLAHLVYQPNKLKFFQWKLNDILTYNNLKFYEPKQNSVQKNPDLILVPMIAFDKNGFRLGYGKGFYDRYLKNLKRLNNKMEAIGVAFAFQNCKKIPSSKYDFQLNKIFTEKGFIK